MKLKRCFLNLLDKYHPPKAEDSVVFIVSIGDQFEKFKKTFTSNFGYDPNVRFCAKYQKKMNMKPNQDNERLPTDCIIVVIESPCLRSVDENYYTWEIYQKLKRHALASYVFKNTRRDIMEYRYDDIILQYCTFIRFMNCAKGDLNLHQFLEYLRIGKNIPYDGNDYLDLIRC